MLSSVYEIVKKYKGEGLRHVVETEMHRRHKMLVKANVSKSERAAKKANELAKTAMDIDWDEKIKSGTLTEMYVSQLDMYLMEITGFSRAQVNVVMQAWRVFFFSVEILALIAKLLDLLPVYLSLYQNEMVTDCYGTYGTQSRRI